MKRIFIMIAVAAFAMLGFAAPASADGSEPELLGITIQPERKLPDLDEPPEPTSQNWECAAPGEVTEGGITLPGQKPWDYDIFAGDGNNEDGEFHVLPADTYDVEATPDFEGDNTWELTIEDLREREDCLVEVTPEVPEFSHPECVDGGIVPGESVIPEQTGVVYDPAEGGEVNHGDHIDVQASPAEGYFFPEGAIDFWEFIGVQPGCDGDDGKDGNDGDDGETPPPATSDKTCDDFDTHAEAIAHVATFPGDLDRLDGDDDGVPCESIITDDVEQTSSSTEALPKTGASPIVIAGVAVAIMLIGLALVVTGRLRASRR